ncbi:Hypothetical protein CINCED_3A011872 [Cinara cedri]|uniref:G-protein coupled receptors family 1 profile domain-containing protein n=1 Tax=Cinara cedri TaxID=506608 RepID=A0A5E4MBF1_9HEMI|nr:Hypothetical protein CINCED_3A011872 [Cinara cedri]
MMYFDLSLPTLLLLINFDSGNTGATGTKNNTAALQASLCTTNLTQDTNTNLTHYHCDDTYCILRDKLCDGIQNCPQAQDEAVSECGCNYNEYRCANQCIELVKRCDRFHDCDGGEDEENCKFYTCPLTHFKCGNYYCIPTDKVCDFNDDCGDGSDEQHCQHRECWHSEIKCNNSQCIRPGHLCDGKNHCVDGSDEEICGNDDFVKCGGSKWIHSMFWCNGYPECTDNHADELNCGTKCPDNKFRCTNGRCINKANVCDGLCDCLQDVHGNGHCDDEKECEKYYTKIDVAAPTCEGSPPRCIHQDFVCDKKNDCFNGNTISDEFGCDYTYKSCTLDEFQCDNGQCIPLKYKCKKTEDQRTGCVDQSHLQNCGNSTCAENEYRCHEGFCIKQSMVCNDHVDCDLTWDDEECPFKCSEITDNCLCQDIHVNCTGSNRFPFDVEKEITFFHLAGNNFSGDLHSKTFQNLGRLVHLDLRNNSITHLEPFMFSMLLRLKTLNLQNNNITILQNGSFNGLNRLTGLHLNGNKIRKLNSFAFVGLYDLLTLDLSNQNISVIEPDAFSGLRKLISLDLKFNSLTHIRDGTFRGMPQVVFLDLAHNPGLKVIEPDVFYTMESSLKTLATTAFRFCCLAPFVTQCTPLPDEFSSCEDLMSNIVLRVCIWILAVVAISANLMVIVYRAKYQHNNQVHSFLIVNLALSDVLMGSYLLIIAVVDWYYRGVYIIHDADWRNSTMCNVAGFLSTFSSELSVFTLTVITLERLLVIIFPFKLQRLEMDFTRVLMAACWLLATIISVIPLLDIPYFNHFYGRSGVCLALHITKDKPAGWEYSVFIFLFVNLGSLLLISGGYLWMFFAAKMTHRATETLSSATRVTTQRSHKETAMAWRMSLLVATDAACWVPIIGLGLLSLAGFEVPPQVFAWVAVFVLPLNAAVNPVLYTLSAVPMIRRNAATNHFIRRSTTRITNDTKRTSTTLMPYSNTQCETMTLPLIAKIQAPYGRERSETVETEINGKPFGKML